MAVLVVVLASVRPGFVIVNRELRRRDAGAENPGGVDVVAGDGQGAERALQFVERQPGVEQRAQHHVSRNARETIEVQQAAHNRPISLKLQ